MNKSPVLKPKEKPVLRLVAPYDQRALGEQILGGWLLTQCDYCAGLYARQTIGNAIIRAISNLVFHAPLFAGECYEVFAQTMKTGNTSLTIELSGWAQSQDYRQDVGEKLVLTAEVILVAIDEKGKPRSIQ